VVYKGLLGTWVAVKIQWGIDDVLRDYVEMGKGERVERRAETNMARLAFVVD
jgi:hypothetical protein